MSADPLAASVVISTCRLQDQVRSLVMSLLDQQGVGRFEVLLVDNSCSPQTKRAVADLRPPPGVALRYLPEPRPGLHNVRHRGAIEASCDNLIYLDDDVVLSPDWLRCMCARLQDPNVAMIGGRVLLRFESPPPVWVEAFRGLLSELDLGSAARQMSPDVTPIGCNLAVRRSLLVRVGGFNPDAFADSKLLRFRGDGEVGLARKIRDLGLAIWYEPGARLEHLVPAKRMSAAYVRWRSKIGGIEQAYSSYRYYPRPFPILLYRALRSLRRAAVCKRLASPDPFAGPESVAHHIQSTGHLYCALHHLRQFVSPGLRRWTRRRSYLPE